MSANTYWRPHRKGTNVPCVSSFLDTIAEAKQLGGVVGEVALDESDVSILRGIAAADKSTREAVNVLIEAIERHGTIYVWREY